MLTTFADVVPIKPINSHQYAVNFEDDWCIGTVPNGGYTTSMFLIIARTHMQHTHSSRSQPHPINLHLEFYRRTLVGPGTFTVVDVKIGARISNLHITLSQKQANGKTQDEVAGYIMMSNIHNETGLSLDTTYSLSPPALPVDFTSLAKDGTDTNYARRSKDPFPKFRRASQHCALHLIKPSARTQHNIPKSIIDQWTRFTPTTNPTGGRWTNDALGYLVDMFPQMVEGYVNAQAEEAAIQSSSLSHKEVQDMVRNDNARAKYWYPTLSLNLDVKKLLPEEGVEWLFVRVRSKKIEKGRFDLDIEVWDEAHELVATSQHCSLVVDSERNVTRGGKRDGARI